jgi:hypothetical protein
VRIAFIGASRVRTLFLGGIPFAEVFAAEPDVSSFLVGQGSTFSISELTTLIAGLKTKITSVGQFFTVPQNNYPFYHTEVLLSRSGGQVAGYGTTFGGQTVPRYIVLPQLRDLAQAIIQILGCLESVWPSLFPDKIKRDWLQSAEFLLPEERQIQKEIQEVIARATQTVADKKTQQEELAKKNSFIRNLLVAKEDPEAEPEERLSGVVRKTLEFLGFRVEDIDQKTKSAIKKEDFWVIDRDYLGITEVTGTVNKNPKIKEFNDILGRMATIYKRKTDLVLPEGVSISGLLVLNYDINAHPSKRPKAYTGEDEHIVQTAIEQNIGVLSTVELHKIIVAVEEGALTKAEARALLTQPGRIEYERGGPKPPPDRQKD